MEDPIQAAVTCTWTEDCRVAIISIEQAITRDLIEQWKAVVTKTIRQWEANQPVAVLLDFLDASLRVTPHSTEILDAYYRVVPRDRKAYYALCVEPSSGSYLVEVYIAQRAGSNPNIAERVFMTRDACLNWIYEQLPAL